MDNEKKETRRAFLSIFISLISIVCFFTCGGAAYSQTGAGFYGNPGNSGSWQRPAPSRPPPARPRPVPRPYRGYWEEVGYQWQGFGLAACEAVHSTGDLAYGGLQIGGYIVGGLAYGVGLVRDPARLVPPNPGSWQSGMMNGFDARCKNGEAGAATAELVINTATCGIVPLIEGAGNDVLTGSNNTMGWLGGQFGGTAVGAGTAPIGGMLWPMVRPLLPSLPTAKPPLPKPGSGRLPLPEPIAQPKPRPVWWRVQAPAGEALCGRPAARLSPDGISAYKRPVCVGDEIFVRTYLTKKPGCEVVGIEMPPELYDAWMSSGDWQPFGDKMGCGFPQRVDPTSPGIGLQLPSDVICVINYGYLLGEIKFIPAGRFPGLGQR